MVTGSGGGSSLADFVHVARRRAWIIAIATIVVATVATVHSVRQPALYESSAQVLLTPQSAAVTYAGGTTSAPQDPVRYAATQTFLARSPVVAESVVRGAHAPGLTSDAFLGSSRVNAASEADLLTFWVTSRDPALAQKLAGLYASAFTEYRRALDTGAIRTALKQLQARLAALSPTDGTLRSQLLDRIQSLETTDALERSSTYVARPAGVAGKISPRPKRDAFLGLALGLILGLALAFVREALDTRVHAGDEIAARLGLSVLGRIPAPAKRLATDSRLVMIEAPYTPGGETFRMLRTSLDLANLDRQARTLMVTSGLEGEGKTTTACNLAVALASAGRQVVLVDLDLRRPSVHRFFQLRGRPGVTDVALGDVELDDALANIAFGDFHGGGSLRILPAGPMPPNPGEFVGTQVVSELLTRLRDRFDVVIVDTPPVLHAVEAMAVSTQIDGMLIVVHVPTARRGTLSELRRVLDQTPATKLGLVLTGVGSDANYGLEEYGPYAYPVDGLVT